MPAASEDRVSRRTALAGLTEPGDQDMFGPLQRYPASQPINFVRADAPPMLLVQGLNDETVKPKNARNLLVRKQFIGAAAAKLPIT
jgi:hypothetical protein